jgi:hypothetical protein
MDDKMNVAELAPAAERPWFRQPFVWMVIGIPLSSVIVGMIMLWLSIVSFDGMVADDYYKQGLQINRVLDRERAARAAELSGTFELHPTDSRLALKSARSGYALPDKVRVQLSFATRAGQDRDFAMLRSSLSAANEYIGPALSLPPGRWYVYVSADAGESTDATTRTSAWRLSGILSTPGDGVVVMSPQAPQAGS